MIWVGPNSNLVRLMKSSASELGLKLSSWTTVGAILFLIGRVELVFVSALGNKFRSFVQESTSVS